MQKVMKVGRKVTAQYVMVNNGAKFEVKEAGKLSEPQTEKVIEGLAAFDDFSTRNIFSTLYAKSILVYCMIEKGKFDHVTLIRDTINSFAKKMNLVVLRLPVSDFFLLAETDVLEEELTKLGLADKFNSLHPIKYLERIKKVLGRFEKMPDANLAFDDSLEPGIALISKEYSIKSGLRTGDKLSVVLKSTVVVDNGILFDIIVSNDEDKLKMGDDLGHHIYKSLNHNAHIMNNTGCISKFNEHTYANFDMYNPNPDLTQLKKFLKERNYTGTNEEEKFLYDLCGYWDKKTGMVLLGKVGLKIKQNIWDASVDRALDILVSKYIRERVIYLPVYMRGGLALPYKYAPAGCKVLKGLVTRYPCDVPIYDTVFYSDETECYYVNPELWKFFGGDYDGDLVHIYSPFTTKFLKAKIPNMRDVKNYFSWHLNKNTLLKSFYMPKKSSQMDSMDFDTAWKAVKKSEGNIGKAHTMVKACIEVLSLQEKDLARRQMYSIYFAGKYIQPAIDSKKYVNAYKEVNFAAILKSKRGYVDYYKALIRLVVRSIKWSDLGTTRIRVVKPTTYFEKVFVALSEIYEKEVTIKPVEVKK